MHSTPFIVVGLLVLLLVWLQMPAPASGSGWLPESAAISGRPPVLRSRPAVWMTTAMSAVIVVVVARGGVVSVVVGLGVVTMVFAVRFLMVQALMKRVRLQRQRAVIEFCDALCVELQAGLPVVRALAHASEAWPEWRPIASAAALGADIAAVLRSAADDPGAAGLRAIAAAWEVAGEAGAGLAGVLANISRGLRNDEEARAELSAALGPTRATAKLLAVLPLFGLAMGTTMGAEPVGFILDTAAGRVCLVGGVLLVVAGLAWVERLARSIED
jgi:tight adherence protein B